MRLLEKIAAIGLCIIGATALAAGADSKTAEKAVDPDHEAKMAKGLDIFKKQVRPVLVQQCLKCHGGKDMIEADLDISDRAGLLKGGTSGPAILVGKGR